MKDKIKKIIILLGILLAICIILMIIFNQKVSSEEDYSRDSELVEPSFEINIDNKITYEKNKNIYYTLVSIVTKYIDSASMNDTQTLLNMIGPKCIEKYNINESNIIETTNISVIESDFDYYIFKPETIYSIDEGKITTHFVKGFYYNVSSRTNKKDTSFMIEIDTVNQTFNIYNSNYIADNNYSDLKIGDTYKSDITEIENRGDNIFSYTNYTDEEMASKYLEDYKDLVLYDRVKAFEILDEEYAKLRFKNQTEFNSFVENKKIEIFKAQLSKYKVEYAENGNKIYVCEDQNGNYYSFEETDGVMKYKVILDNYTIVNDEFIEKYNNLSAQQKVALNIEKFVQAINDKSYNYAYNCLADSFKNNYFRTQEEFETYVKSNFYESNSIKYNSFEKQGELYTYSVTITNTETNEQKTKTFIMQLGQGTEFVLSFDR